MSDSDVEMANQDSEEYEYLSNEDSDIEYTYDENEDDEHSFDGNDSFNDGESKQNDSRSPFSAPGSGSKKQLEYRVLDKDLLVKRKEGFQKWIFEAPASHHDHKGLVVEQVAEIQKALVN